MKTETEKPVQVDDNTRVPLRWAVAIIVIAVTSAITATKFYFSLKSDTSETKTIVAEIQKNTVPRAEFREWTRDLRDANPGKIIVPDFPAAIRDSKAPTATKNVASQ